MSFVATRIAAAAIVLVTASVACSHDPVATATPIQHVVVIFQENVSFDHYFGKYPQADNPVGEPAFLARRGTPTVNGLSEALLTSNPNGFNPFRLDRSAAATCDQNHDYTPEQQAYDNFAMDKFIEFTGVGGPGCPDLGLGVKLTMGYYDGNTVTALWNYAQNFAMSDNSYGTTFGPSAPGALNLMAGQTNGATPPNLMTAFGPDTVDGSVISDPQPTGDKCTTRDNVTMSGLNIGDLLNGRNISWGFFQGGFDLSTVNPDGSTGCTRTHTSTFAHVKKVDYIPHHEPFQYYPQTANPMHVRPTSVSTIGQPGDPANHQYDLDDFFAAASAGNVPAVSFLKAAGYQDGHAGYSTPLDEQTFLVNTINFLQQLPEYKTMAIIIAWDDSDGWYDHQPGPLVNGSTTSADALTGPGACGSGPTISNQQGRCGYGPRLPLLVISPFAKRNFVDHTVTDQSSILRFIEDNWNLGLLGNGSFDVVAGSLYSMFDFGSDRPRRGGIHLYLDPDTGTVIGHGHRHP